MAERPAPESGACAGAADEADDGDPSLITSITIEFAMTNNDYDEEGWIRVSRGCTRTFYEEDFERFYGRTA
jgi:hypothetical protein